MILGRRDDSVKGKMRGFSWSAIDWLERLAVGITEQVRLAQLPPGDGFPGGVG